MRVYWAGDRGFCASGRWHDVETIRHLEPLGPYEVLYPFPVDAAPGAAPSASPQAIRAECLRALGEADAVLAYVGGYDTGTAQEIELAKARGIPVVAWSDQALVRGEVALGRQVALAPEAFATQLALPVRPLNAMTSLVDLYLEDSRLVTPGLSPAGLAGWLHEGLARVLKRA